MAEAYRKEFYPKHFYSKLTDSDGEIWNASLTEFALSVSIFQNQFTMNLLCESLEMLINYMIINPEKFGGKE
jgi:hypothetical protein